MKKALLSLLVLLASTANAADKIELANRLGLGLNAGAAIPVATTLFKNNASTGWAADVHADYYLCNAFGLELSYDRLNFKSSAPYSSLFGLGFIYRFMPTAILTPVAGLKAGFANTSDSPVSTLNFNNLFASAKLGLNYALSNNWVAELSAKYNFLLSDTNGSANEHSIAPMLGITYFFDGKKVAAAAPTSVAQAVDGDDDKDGIPNSIDKCPKTPSGVKVNSIGCKVDEKVDFTIDIQFDPASAAIKKEYHNELAKMGALLKEHTDLTADIQGYTDNTGKKEKNVTLSGARAKAVQDYLVSQFGIEASRLTSKGFGPENPIASNKTADGRKKNRRVVASLHSK